MLRDNGVYALAVFTVESIYYDPEVQRRVASRHAEVTGTDAEEMIANAIESALQAVGEHKQRMAVRKAETQARKKIFANLPTHHSISEGTPINVTIDVATLVTTEETRLDTLIQSKDLTTIIRTYPVRETPALDRIAISLGFQCRRQYESAVRALLLDNNDALTYTKGLFEELPDKLGE
jgi:hypothetical protein